MDCPYVPRKAECSRLLAYSFDDAVAAMFEDAVIQQEIRKFATYYARHPESLAFARLADAYRKAGRPREALELLEKGLRRHPGYLAAHSVRARTLRDVGRRSEARAAFREVLDLDPQNLVALQALEEMAREEGRAQEAANWHQRLRALESPAEADSAETTRVLKAGDETEPEEITEGGPTDELVVTSTMADLLLRQELYEEAATVYGHLLRNRPGDPELQAKLETAQRLSVGRPKDRRRGGLLSRPFPPPDPGDGITFREYLNRLLEGRAEPESAGPTGASRFRKWLEMAGATD